MWRYIPVFFILIQMVNLAQLTHYEVLGVSRDASQQEIRSAYKKLAIKFHPDKNPDADQQKQFLRVSEAYETLRDARRRRMYDGWAGHDPQEMERGLYYDDPYVVSLSGHNYDSRLTEGMHFVNFYSPACPPCRRLAPHWSRLAELYQDVVHFSAVNCRAQSQFCHNVMRIGSYPTLLFYPNGRAGNFIYYNGALDAGGLEQFLSRVVSERAPAPPAARARPAAPAPLLYVLSAWRFEDGAANRLAYRLRGIATVLVVEDDSVRAQLARDAHVTSVLQVGATRTPLAAAERDLPRAAAAALPPPTSLGPDDIKEIRSSLRGGGGGGGGGGGEGGGGRPRALRLRAADDGDDDLLEFLRLQADLPELDFGMVDCVKWSALCAALQVPGGGRWAVLKRGGAYQAAPPATQATPPTASFLRRAAACPNLHSLSETEYNRVLDGESGMWLVGAARGAELLEPFLTAAERLRHRDDLQLGVLHGAGAGAGVQLQRGGRRHALPAPVTADELLHFLDLLLDDAVEYLSSQRVLELAAAPGRGAWLVACLPRDCPPECARAAHRWRQLARTLRPLKDVRVGLLQCAHEAGSGGGAGGGEGGGGGAGAGAGGGGGLCDNVRVPSARLYRGADRYGVSLQEVGEGWRAAQWALGLLGGALPELGGAEFADNVMKPGNDEPWLVYFHSPRCHRCHEMYPDFAVASMVLEGRARAARVDCLAARALCQRERVTSYPSLRLYRRGHAAALAAASADNLLAALEPMLPKLRQHDEF